MRHTKDKRRLASAVFMSALTFLSPILAHAGPTNGSVVGGSATINQGGSTTTINQVTDRAIINWDGFSIGSTESVLFNQPGTTAVALNRVIGADASQILGTLTANGNIFLVNPNGILFGAGSQVDVAGLAATTLDIDNDAFMAGTYDFKQNPLASASYVINRGVIRTGDNGFVYLVAPGVENSGFIVARSSEVVLGSGTEMSLDFGGDGLIQFPVSGQLAQSVLGPDGQPMSSAVANSGSIVNPGGQVLLTGDVARSIMTSAVSNSGVIEATSLASLNGGEVILYGRANGDVRNDGLIRVGSSAPDADAGGVGLLGENVTQGATGEIVWEGAGDGSGNGFLLMVASENLTVDGTISTQDVPVEMMLLANSVFEEGSAAAGETGSVLLGTSLNTNGGTVLFGGVNFENTAAGSIVTDGGPVVIENTGDIKFGGTVNSGAGGIIIPDAASVTVNSELSTTGSALLGAQSGNITTTANGLIRADQLNLLTSQEGATIGQENNALRVDANILSAQANAGHIVIRDLAGGVAVGTINTGGDKGETDATRAILTAHEGAITSALGGEGITAWSANLVTTGTPDSASDWSIGSSLDPLKTAVSVLAASTESGNIHLNQSGAVILNDITAKQQGVSPFANADGKIVIDASNTVGTHAIAIHGDSDILVSGLLSAPGSIALSSTGGSLLDTMDSRTFSDGSNFITRNLTLEAANGIGHEGDAFEISADTLNASAHNGGVYLTEAYGLEIGHITANASGLEVRNDVHVTASSGDIAVGQVTAAGGNVSINSNKGALTDANGAVVNITAESASLVGTRGIGTAADRIETNVVSLALAADTAGRGIYITENNELDSLSIDTKSGNVLVAFGVNTLNFNAGSGVLAQSGGTLADLNFRNAGGAVALGGLNAGAHGNIEIEARSSITRNSGSLIADTATLTAGTSIGAAGQAIATDINVLDATASSGSIHVAEQSGGLTVTASANGANSGIAVTAPGDLLVNTVSAAGNGGVTLTSASGNILNGLDGSGNNISATSATLNASGSIGNSDNAVRSAVSGDYTANAGAGGINIVNAGDISLLNASSGGDVAFSNSGDIALGELSAPGRSVNLAATGTVTDANDPSPDSPAIKNITAAILALSGRSIGETGNAIEIDTGSLEAVTTNGGLYLSQVGEGDLFLLYVKSSGNMAVDAAGDILLGVVEAPGYSTAIHAAGTIEDHRASNETRANVKAKSLEMSGSGIGTEGKLSLDVNFLSASGGSGGVSASNLGAVVVDSASLVGKGGSTVSISGASITILDEASDYIQLDPGGSLVLVAESGNIVFLDINDTIAVSGGGSIHLSALYVGKGSDLGKSGVIVAGNLQTDGGDITLQAESHISIGLLDAGFGGGDVSVRSNNGLIIDNNGAATNIIGRNVTLSGKTPTEYMQEVIREAATATAASDAGVVTSTNTQVKTLSSEHEAYQLMVNNAFVNNALAQNQLLTAAYNYAVASRDLNSKQSHYDSLITALQAASLAKSVGEFIAGAAQAVPFSGDAGAAAAFAVVAVALDAAALAADIYSNTTLTTAKNNFSNRENQLATAEQLAANASDYLKFSTDLLNSKAVALDIAEADLFSAQVASAASTLVREQALRADSNNNVIGTASQPLGVQATRLDIQTFNRSDVFLESPGHLGLGHVEAAGNDTKITAHAAQNLSVLGEVVSPTSISLSAGGSILGSFEGILVAPEIVAQAANGIGELESVYVRTDLLAADGGLGGARFVNVNEDNTLTVGTVGGVVGVRGARDILVATSDDLRLEALVEDRSRTHQVALVAGMDGEGDIIDANGASRNVIGGELVAMAPGHIDLDTDVAFITAYSHEKGDLTIRETDGVQLDHLIAVEGRISVNANGNTVVGEVTSATDALANEIEIVTTAGDMTVGTINSGATSGVIKLTASNGQVNDDNDEFTRISGHDLTISAAQGIGASGANHTRALDTTVDTLTANVTTGGQVNVIDSDDLEVLSVVTPDGDVTLISGAGNLNIHTIAATGTGNTVTLFAEEGIRNVAEGDAVNVIAANLAMVANQGIGSQEQVFRTTVDRLEAHELHRGIYLSDTSDGLIIGGVTPGLELPALSGLYSSEGNIQITAEGSIVTDEAVLSGHLGDISLTASQSIFQNADITAAGEGDIGLVAKTGDILMSPLGQTEALDGDITYTAAGDILVHEIAANGDVVLTATAGTISGQPAAGRHVIANDLNATAAKGIGSATTPFTTAIDTLTAQVTGKGAIHLNESNAIELTDVRTADGLITITTGGAIDALSVVSATDTDANDIRISAAHGDIRVGTISAGTTAGDVFLTATTGAINDDQDNATRITADALVLTAANGLGVVGGSDAQRSLDTTANSLTATLTSGGVINVSESDDLNVLSATTPNGDVTIQSAAGSLNLTTIAANGTGNTVTLEAAKAITDAHNAGDQVNITAANLAMRAGTGIGKSDNVLEVTVDRMEASGGNGGVYVTDLADGLIIGGVTPNLSLAALNGIEATGADIVITALSPLTVEEGITHMGAGDIVLTAGSSAGADDITLNAAVRSLGISGNISMLAADSILQNAEVSVGGEGNIALTATSGDITMTTDAFTTTGAGNVTYTAADDILVHRIAANGDVQLTATAGAITGQPSSERHVNAKDLTATAAHGIGEAETPFLTAIDTLTGTVTSDGAIYINELNNVRLNDVSTADGLITINAGGTIEAVKVVSLTDADANDIRLTATEGGSILIDTVNAGSAHGDVYLTANTGEGAIRTNEGGRVTADNLQATARSDIDLTTTANTTTLTSTAAGDISITEHDAIELTDVTTADGAIDVTAGGTIHAIHVASLTDADANDIHLTATNGGDIFIDTVDAGVANGDVVLTANTNDAMIRTNEGGRVTADNLQATARTDIDLTTTVNRATLDSTLAGGIYVDELDSIELTHVQAANGSITVMAGDRIDAVNVVSASDLAGNDIALTTAAGDIFVRTISAGSAHGNVTLTAADSIVDDADNATKIGGNALTLTAANGIGMKGDSDATRALDTAVNSLEATVTRGGSIHLAEDDDLAVLDVTTPDGDVTVTSAEGTLAVTRIAAGGADNTVTLAAAGAVLDATGLETSNVDATNLAIRAGAGIGTANNAFETTVDRIEAAGGNGGVYLADLADGLTVGGVTPNLGRPAQTGISAEAGDIRLTAEGSLQINEAIAHNGNGNTSVTASENIVQNAAISTAGAGDIELTATAGDITLTDASSTTAANGNVAYVAGGSIEQNGAIAASGSIDLTAQSGDIVSNASIASTGDAGHVVLTASENIVQNAAVSAAGFGDIKLTATAGDITLTDASSATAAHGNVTYEAGGSIEQNGAIAASDNIRLTAQSGDIVSNASIASTGDAGYVVLKANENIVQNAAISAAGFGDIKLTTTAGDITLTDASSTTAARGNVAYVAGGSIEQNGAIAASDNIDLTAQSGDIVSNASIGSTGDAGYVFLTANEDIVQNATISAAGVGDIELRAIAGDIILTNASSTTAAHGNVTYVAGGLIEQNGAIAASDNIGLVAQNGGITSNASIASTGTVGRVILLASDNIVQNAAISAAGTGDIELIAEAGDISLTGASSTNAANGNVTYTSAGSIEQNGAIAASGGIEFTAMDGHIVNNASITSTGNLGGVLMMATESIIQNAAISNAGAGGINLIAVAGDISMGAAASTTTADGIIAYAVAGDLLLNTIDAQGDVVLNAETGSIEGQSTASRHVTARNLRTSSAHGVGTSETRLATAVDTLEAVVTGQGSIYVSEAESIDLNRLSTADGRIEVTAGGRMTAHDVVSVTDAAGNDIVLQSTGGDIIVDRVAAGAGVSGNVALTAAGSIAQHSPTDASADVIGNSVNLHAGQSIAANAPIQIEANLLNATAEAGDIRLATAGDIMIGSMRAANGIGIDAGGAINDDNDNATRIEARHLLLSAVDGIGTQGAAETRALDTSVDTLMANVSEAGAIRINEASDLYVIDANTAAGDIEIQLATGDLRIGRMIAGGQGATADLTALEGGIRDGNPDDETDVAADRVILKAVQGIGASDNALDVATEWLQANGGMGGVYIANDSASVTVAELGAEAGDIVLGSTGFVDLAAPVSNLSGGSVRIHSDDTVEQNADITVTGRGAISVIAAKDIVMGTNALTKADRGVVTYQAGNTVALNRIETNSDRINGGQVNLIAPTVTQNHPELAAVVSGFFSLQTQNATLAQIESLLGGRFSLTGIRMNGRIAGGKIADDATFVGTVVEPSYDGTGSQVIGIFRVGESDFTQPAIDDESESGVWKIRTNR